LAKRSSSGAVRRGSGGAPARTGARQKQLRTNVADVLRRAEAGEEFTITVAGRPVAQLGPARRRQGVTGPELGKVWDTPAPHTLAGDLERLPAELADPFTH
jgi:prevent-host-death family protein